MSADCFACNVALAEDGVCRLCGRGYRTALLKPGDDAPYRDAPVYDVAQLREPVPKELGLHVRSDDDVLDIEIGAPNLLGSGEAGVLFSIALFAVPVGLIAFALSLSPIALVVLAAYIFLSLAMVKWGRMNHQELIVGKGWLSLSSFHDEERLGGFRVELEQIAGVHATDDSVRIDMTDGSSVDIAKGLDVPVPIRQWVARRVALHLPLPPPPPT